MAISVDAELSALSRVAEAASAAPDLGAFLERTAAEIRTLLGGEIIAFFLYDPAQKEKVLLHIEGGGPEASSLLTRIPFEETSLAKGTTPRLHQMEDAPEPTRSRLARLGLATLVSIPLRFRSMRIGTLTLAFQKLHQPADLDLDLLKAIGAHCASAIETHRAYAEARRRVQELSSLETETRRRAEELGLILELSRSLAATLDLDPLLETGARNLARIVEAPDAYILLAEDDRLVVRAASSPQNALVGRFQPLTGEHPSVARTSFERRAPLIVEDGENDPRVDAAFHPVSRGRAYLGLPLVVRDRAIGAAVIVETRRARAFTTAEVERATAIANQVAVAADNARLYADLRRSYAELAHAQDRIVRQERLAALGELAAVVAHEVRNPLGAIFNSLGALKRLVKPSGDARMLFDIVGEEADRLNHIVGDLLDFARPTSPALHPESLARVVDEAAASALASAQKPIQLTRHIPPDLPLVPMDVRLMRQVLLNLAINAVQAMPDGGTLSVGIALQGNTVVLEIADTGPGIPDDVRHRIFEPFFTTRATGTGLGLALVKRVVEDHHGQIEARAAPGHGTIFNLRLPLEETSLAPG